MSELKRQSAYNYSVVKYVYDKLIEKVADDKKLNDLEMSVRRLEERLGGVVFKKKGDGGWKIKDYGN